MLRRVKDSGISGQFSPAQKTDLLMKYPEPPAELIEDWIELAKPLPNRPPDPNKLAALAAAWGYQQCTAEEERAAKPLDAPWLDCMDSFKYSESSDA